MTQPLAYGEIETFENPTLETKLVTPILDETGCIVEEELENSDETKQKRKFLPLFPKSKSIDVSLFTNFMKHQYATYIWTC